MLSVSTMTDQLPLIATLTLGLLFYAVLWATTLGAFRPLSLERSGIYILLAGLSAGITFGADRLLHESYGLTTLARTLGESAFLALVLFLRSVRIGLTRKQEIVGSWLVLAATVLHLLLNLTLTGPWLLWVMAVQIVALFSWVLREAVLLQHAQPSGMTRMLVVMVSLQIFLEAAGRGTMGVLLWLDPMGRGADWAATLGNWLWITFSVGFAVLTTTAAVLMEAFRADKFRLEQVVQKVEDRLRDKQSVLLSLLLSNAERDKDPGVASLAHELRQPLHAIQLNVEYLSSGKSRSKSEEAEILQSILRENRRAAELVHSLRNIFVNKALEQPASLNLSSWLSDWAKVHAPALLREKGVSLQVHAQPQVLVQANPTQLEVVLQNLLTNAVQALADQTGGTVDVSLAGHGPWARIDVLDNGPGIAPEACEKVFEMGYTTKDHGMGFGLWLSRRIVQMQGGELAAVPGLHGAHLRVTLPLASA